ncbi:MAG: hypothetical protein D6732_00480, partial [Methanobacteriota archaeon]
KAISWTDSVYRAIQELHPDKRVIIGETGWATRFNPNKKGPGEQGTLIKGTVGIEAQKQFLLQLHDWVTRHKVTTFLFEAFDEPWKGGGEQSGPEEVEKNWGVFYENRTPKPSFREFVKQLKKHKSNQPIN